MTTDNGGFIAIDERIARRRIAVMHIHHIPYADFTEMVDEPRLAHNDSSNIVDDGIDRGLKELDSSD